MVARGGLARVRPFTWLPPPLHRGRFMPEKNLRGIGRQSPRAAGKAAAAGR